MHSESSQEEVSNLIVCGKGPGRGKEGVILGILEGKAIDGE